MTDVKPVLALPEGFHFVGLEKRDDRLTITLVSTQVSPCCPRCGRVAKRVHSSYTRQVADLPCGGQSLCFLIQVRRYFCEESTCPRKIFAERLTLFVDPFARVTKRLFQIVQILGLATGGRLGMRVTDRIGIQTSRQTILRRIMALPTKPIGQVLQVGIDDFSFRRGRKFGTIIVDLQTHTVLEVLPDRTADTSAAWMAAHPEIELVSRDRGGDYATATRKALPGATQTADRFHLLKNLGEALEGVLARHLSTHRRQQAETLRATPVSTGQDGEPSKRSSKKVAIQEAKREERLACYQQVVALRQLGLSQTAIASQVGIGHATVSRWLSSGMFPEQQPRPRSTRVNPYLPQLVEQWETGCYTIAELYRELVAHGYPYSYDSVYRQLIRFLPERQKRQYTCPLPEEQKTPQLSEQRALPPVQARQAAFLFLRRACELEKEEQATLTQLRSLHPEVDRAYELIQQFAQMLRTRTGEQLDDWLCHVRASKIRELQGFVAGVLRDKEAVKAGLTLRANNGLVEGKVNKLKLIKRMGYGRAAFPLLRQRVLHAL